MYILNPYITDFLLQVKDEVLMGTAIVLFIIFVLDVVYSCLVAYNLRNRIIIVEDLKNEKLARIPGMLERMLNKRVKGIRRYPKRLLKAFPTLWKTNEKEFEIMKKIDQKSRTNAKKKKKKTK